MPAVQTTFNSTMRAAVAGMPADMTPAVDVSRVVEGASGLGFGVVCVKGTGDRQVKAPDGTSAFVGITLMDPTLAPATPPSTVDAYPQYDICRVRQKGTVWVTVGEAVNAMDAAYYVPATGALMKTATSNTAIPGGRFITSAANGALAVLQII